MTNVAPLAQQLLTLNEADLPALVGERALSRANKILEYGGIIGPRAAGSVLTSRVRDASGRSFTTSASVGDLGLDSTCTCGQRQPCEHAAALLAYWTADRERFAQPELVPGAAQPLPHFAAGALWRGVRGHAGGLIGLLQPQRVADLRKLAPRVGVDGAGVEKELLATQLAPRLAARAYLEPTLAALAPQHASALSLLMLADAPVSPDELDRAAQLLHQPFGTGGALAALKALGAQALAFTTMPSAPESEGWQAPLEVCQLPPPAALPLAAPTVTPDVQPRGDMVLPTLLRALQLLLTQQPIEARLPRRRDAFEAQNGVLSAWNNLPDEIEALQQSRQNLFYQNAELTVAASEPMLSDAAITRLATTLACEPAELRLLLRLLEALHALEARGGAVRFSQGAAELLALPALDQARLLANAWANDTRWSEVHELDDVVLRRSLNASFYLRPDQLYAELAAARRFVVRLVRALDPNTWHSVESLCEQARPLAPRSFLAQPHMGGTPGWKLALVGGRKLDLTKSAGWSQVGAPFVRAVLRCMAWLGIVDADAALSALRVTPLGSYLLGLTPIYGAPARPPALDVRRDLELRLAARDADAALLQTLDRAAQLVRFEQGQFVYRITPARLRDALDAGVPLADIAGFLQANGRPPVPKAALDVLNAWASSFGQSQIYTGLSLLELSDELLLPELLRATGLQSALLDQIAPTLLLIDPARVDALWAELVAKGYTPRRVRSL